MNDVELILESTARLSSLLLFIALGELLAERAGTLNISVEGMALGGAFTASYVAWESGSPVLGLLAGIAIGFVIASIQAVLSHRITINQFVVGLAINLLVLGVTSYLQAEIDIGRGQVHRFAIPLLSDLPVVGGALFDQRWIFYLIYPLVPFTWWLLMRTRWGLELRAVGEDPEAATITGISVQQRRRQAVYVCGLYAGLGGAFLSVGLIGGFTPNMTAGRGFIAIAAVILGSWAIGRTVVATLIFGGADALRLALPAIGVEVAPQLLIAAPYLIALVTMFVFAQGRRQPAALGRGYEGLAA
ncbi:MAG: ABC transporter permease [Acidimicrobiia bacterium]